jgi:hypothetical protein
MLARRGSPASGSGSAGVPGCEALALWGEGNESLCIKACLEARLLISRSPARSPRLKFPFPCLNSHNAESGAPVWKTSLTGEPVRKKLAPPPAHGILFRLAFVEPVHVKLPDKRRDVRMLEIVPSTVRTASTEQKKGAGTHARTLANSEEGDMTKLSFEFDHEMRCSILRSSSMLPPMSAPSARLRARRLPTCIICG